ncbi:tetratricopeptide repeat protein [Streptomyces sp. NBC_01537]|uniref:hypothetical protein n=1 Tax=Streptomyces sp. NBC_01537 TaxID=2903896 RepID=UPI00386937C5
MKDLLFEVYTAADEPSLDAIAMAIADDDSLLGAPGRDTIRRCISDQSVPTQRADAVAVAVVLARWAGWDTDALAPQIGELWIKARLTTPPGDPLAAVTDPFALGVHHAISTDLLSTGPPLPLLPVYVERDHDARLRAIADEAKGGVSRLVILTGGSSTGKTRACWELLRYLPGDWRLWHPFDPVPVEAALGAIERIAPRTVVWLNEAQHYLLTASDLGERLAAKLRTLLVDPGRTPVLILGTLWPHNWRTLTAQPSDDADDDPHAQARVLLAGRGLIIPADFGSSDLRTLADRAHMDTRLAYAANHAESGAITQYLAGGPALLERYTTANAGARALVEAAMDARQVGHGPALPLALLEGGATGYLNDAQWDLLDEEWFEQALAYSAKPLRGARGMLTLIRPRTGQPAAAQPHYRLADYLEQHGRHHRLPNRPPATLWNAFIEHAADSDRFALANTARERGLLRIACSLYVTTRGKDRTSAWQEAGDLLADAGRWDEALAWFERAADAGDVGALHWAANLLAAAGRWDEALTLYERAADGGDTDALRGAALRLANAGRLDEALTWYVRAANSGDTWALRRVATWLVYDAPRQPGLWAEALAWLERATDAGDTKTPGWAADCLAENGRLNEALTWYERAAEGGDTEALRAAADRLAKASRLDEALTWYERAAEGGDTEALRRAADQLAWAERWEEALAWYERAGRAGNTQALVSAADLVARAGHLDAAITWIAGAAEGGHRPESGLALKRWLALDWAVDELTKARRTDEAETLSALRLGA